MKPLALVTGAGGAIGRVVVTTLAARQWDVVGLGHGAAIEGLPVRGWINGEIEAANLAALAAAWGRPSAVIHLAGGSAVGPSLVAPEEDFNRTVATCTRLMEWVRRDTPEAAVVLASSAAVYGAFHPTPILEAAPRTPLSPYGFHKAMMEMAGESWAGNFGLKIAMVRLFSVYGPTLRKQLVFELCKRLVGGGTNLVLGGSGAETRDWLHIEDAAAMLIDAIPLASCAAPILNGCTGHATTVAAAASLIASAFPQAVTIEFSGITRV